MIAMLATPEKMLCVALALTALLGMSGEDLLSRWDHAHSGPPTPSCLPWMLLLALAIASSVFGVTHPLEFAATFGIGLPDSRLPVIIAWGP